MCDHRESHYLEPWCEAKSKGLRSSMQSTGVIQGTTPCCPSAWCEENGVDHVALEFIDEEIQRSVSVILAQELEMFDAYHQEGIFPKKKNQCHIL